MLCDTEILAEHFFNPRNVGDATQPSFVGRSASLACGASLHVSLHIDESRRITEAKFRAAGCSVLVASASALTEEIKYKTTAEAAAFCQQSQSFADQLGVLSTDRNYCSALACEAVLSAVRQFSDSVRDEWIGEEALICTCFGISERTIENDIKTADLRTVEEVTEACNAGAGCRSCYPLIEEMLDDYWRTLGK